MYQRQKTIGMYNFRIYLWLNETITYLYDIIFTITEDLIIVLYQDDEI